MKTFLQKIFDELIYLNKVDSQVDFGNKLNYKSEGYISTLLKAKRDIPHKMQQKLHEVFGIDKVFLATNGKEGSMFAIKNDPDNSKSEKLENKSFNEDSQNNNTPLSSSAKTEEVEDMTSTLMLMHKDTIEVMKSLSRSFEDVARANLIQAQMLKQRFGVEDEDLPKAQVA